ncbi:MAG: signal peptide peptidase SppA [Acetobacteraceae bacterium]|nr:signal peptide peptidase SppA [Acetobacteraceae bacterium]
MSLETDLIVDRRRLKRRLFFWRTLAVLAIVGAVIAVVGKRPATAKLHLARLTISGIITESRKQEEAVSALAKDDRVPALVVFINSPGGSVAGGQGLHDAIARVAAVKPVVAVMGGTAASAGYMVAAPASRIFARESTLTGSIGVLLETAQISNLLNTIGISAEAITSGPLKDQPSLTRPLTPEGRAVLKDLVMDMYEQFVAIVASGRHMEPDKVRSLADGRAYTGRQALALGLVDQIGGEPEAREWLASNKGVSPDVPIEDLKPRTWTERALNTVSGLLPAPLARILLSQGLRVDGAWAIWQL